MPLTFRWLRLLRPDKRAHELAVHERSDRVHVNALVGEERSRVLDVIFPRGFDLDGLESGVRQLRGVLRVLQRARDAANPQQPAVAHLPRHVAMYHDVRHSEAAAWFQHAKGLAQHAVLVGGEIDDAVGNNHVHRVVRQRNGLDLTFEELDVVHPGFALVFARQGQHLVGHVQAVSPARRAYAPRRKQHVNAAAGPEIKHRLARVELSQRRRIAASQRGLQRVLGNLAGLGRIVEIGRDGIATTLYRGGSATTAGAPGERRLCARWGGGTAAGVHAQCRLSVLFFDHFLNISAHRVLLLAERNNLFGLDGFVAGATLGIKKAEQLLQRLGVGGVPEESSVAADFHQVFVLELVEMVRERQLGISSSAPMSPTTIPSGCAASSSCMMRNRGSVPMAENISEYRVTCSRSSFFAIAIASLYSSIIREIQNNVKPVLAAVGEKYTNHAPACFRKFTSHSCVTGFTDNGAPTRKSDSEGIGVSMR